MASPGASQQISTFACNFSAQHVTSTHLHQTARAIIDTMAVAIAGRHEHAAAIALTYAQERYSSQMATAWGVNLKLTAEDAAFYNGVAGHVLDYDDVTSPLRGHPSVVLLPPLIALAEIYDKTGTELTASFVVGFEVLCKFAKTMATEHYAKGWHSTATIGTIAATVACAHLLGLDVDGINNAIGIAVAQAAGSRSNFGSMTKSFQAGHSAASAVRAARLAKQGFTGSHNALDGPHGYMDLYANGECLQNQLDTLGIAPLEIESSGLEIKKYPLCYATHRALDGIIALREMHGLTLGNVAHVNVLTSHGGLAPLVHQRPQTGLEAKFSMQYAVAAALHDGHIKLASFFDSAVQHPDIQAFFPKVECSEADGQLFPRWTRIRLQTDTGESLEKVVTTLHGSADQPLSDGELITKVDDCFAYGRHSMSGRTFADVVFQLDELTVSKIIQLAQDRAE